MRKPQNTFQTIINVKHSRGIFIPKIQNWLVFFPESLHGKITQLYAHLNLTREKKQVSNFSLKMPKIGRLC